jgi:biopolymer transport protein ExbB
VLEQKILEIALYYGAEWVLYLLLILGAACVVITVERLIYFALQSAPGSTFQLALHRFLTGGSKEELAGALKDMRGVEARVLLAGLSSPGVDAMEDAIVGTLTFERLQLERGLLVIGTVASNAPFIGLFGTVLGIIKAFHDLAEKTDESASAVMGGISEALVATAVGLLVAIPAVVMYNLLQRRVKSQLARVESLGALMISRLRTGKD